MYQYTGSVLLHMSHHGAAIMLTHLLITALTLQVTNTQPQQPQHGQTHPPGGPVHPAGFVPPPGIYPGQPPIHPSLPVRPRVPMEALLADSSGPFEADSDLEVLHEFKLEIAAGSQECLFQIVRPQSRLYVAFKVLSGPELNIDVVIQRQDRSILEQHLWVNEATTDKIIDSHEAGRYSVCIGNIRSRFSISSKLIHVFLATYVVNDLHHYRDDLEQFDVSVGNASESLQKISKGVSEMRLKQVWGRQNAVSDYYIIVANNRTVQRSSVFLCFIVVMTSVLQVAFVRRLFHESRAATSKQRA